MLDAKIRDFLSVLVVFLWTYIILFLGPFMFLMMIYLTMTDYWWISLTYVTWMIYDHESPVTGGRHAWMRRVFRSWVGWKYWTRYFSLKIVKTHDLDAGHNYLIGSHPHGICAAGAFGAFSTDGADFSHLSPVSRLTSTLSTVTSLLLFTETGSWGWASTTPASRPWSTSCPRTWVVMLQWWWWGELRRL